MDDRYQSLKLSSQLCFPVYACAKEITRAYKPMLDRYDLTYTQYITLMVLWEQGRMNVKKLGDALLLDSGTLTPVLKKLDAKGYITRTRAEHDERNLMVEITETGARLREEMLIVPEEMSACMNLPKEEIETLYGLLYKLLGNVRNT